MDQSSLSFDSWAARAPVLATLDLFRRMPTLDYPSLNPQGELEYLATVDRCLNPRVFLRFMEFLCRLVSKVTGGATSQTGQHAYRKTLNGADSQHSQHTQPAKQHT